MSGSTTKLEFLNEVPKSLFEVCLENPERRVAVLGSVSSWPYIHKICVDIVNCGFVAVTDRYIYKPSEDPDSGYYRVKYENDEKNDEKTADDFIKENIIKRCNSAIIIYPISEDAKFTKWCKDANLRTLGLAFASSIYEDNFCKECVLDATAALAYCCYRGSARNCVPTDEACPFKEQSITNDDLRHFFQSDGKMILVAVEKLEKTPLIIDDFVNEQFSLPNKSPFVFEFRFDINERKYGELLQTFEQLQKDKEDRVNSSYEYIDYYYKPTDISPADWLGKKQSVRIREWKNPLKRKSIVYFSDIEQTSEGFYCKQEFGGKVWFEGELESAKNHLGKKMELFLKTIKMGHHYYLQNGGLGDIRTYIESVEVELPQQDKEKYGYSLEIELWADKPKNVKEINQKRLELVKALGLDDCKHQPIPMQELTYQWVTAQNKKRQPC